MGQAYFSDLFRATFHGRAFFDIVISCMKGEGFKMQHLELQIINEISYNCNYFSNHIIKTCVSIVHITDYFSLTLS